MLCQYEIPHCTEMKFSIKDSFSKYDQTYCCLTYLLKRSLMKTSFFVNCFFTTNIFHNLIAFAWTVKRFLCLLEMLNALHLRFSPSSSCPRLFRDIKKIGGKRYFTDHRAANIIQLFVAIKGNFSGLLFFWTSSSEGKLPRDYLINVATCLFAHH